MEAALGAANGDAPSIAEEGPLVPALDAVGDGQVVQAVGLPGPLLFDPAQVWMATSCEATAERIEDLMDELPKIEPYESILLVELVRWGCLPHGAAGGPQPRGGCSAPTSKTNLRSPGRGHVATDPAAAARAAAGDRRRTRRRRRSRHAGGRWAFNGPLQALITRDVLTVRD